MVDPVLETERLLLRPIQPDDAELQFRTLNSPAITEHLGGPLELDAIAQIICIPWHPDCSMAVVTAKIGAREPCCNTVSFSIGTTEPDKGFGH